MSTQNLLQLSARHAPAEICGGWKLPAGQAISLRPDTPGLLRVARGQVWATVDGARGASAQALGDHFLRAGESLPVDADRHLVLETAGSGGADLVWSSREAPQADTRHATVLAPMQDLRRALSMALHALGRLVTGLAGYGGYLVAGRGRVLRRLEANQP